MNVNQLLASDPHISCWVSASAGTGKTKVLTDRVLRLLLSGAKLHKILCLTFTNATANEMLNRIVNQLKSWACMDNATLVISMHNVLGINPTDNQVLRARSLCQEYLQAKENIAIQTIHSFCQHLLQKFPVEAGINANFSILDELKIKEIINFIQQNLVHNSSELQASLKFIINSKHENSITQLIHSIIDNQQKFLLLLENYSTAESYKNFLLKYFHLSNKESVIKQLFSKFIQYPISKHNNNSKLITNLIEYQQLDYLSFVQQLDQIIALFLTNNGQRKRNLINQDLKKTDLREYLSSLQEDILQAHDMLNSIKIIDSTYHLYNVAIVVLDLYQHYKLSNNCLDYNDLIRYSNKLLRDNLNKDWILYKLNQSIDHILVDEAQDNSLEQWNIILTLLSDSLAGGEKNNHSTFFAVGDNKQAIYSFQGADVNIFNTLNKELKSSFIAAKKIFKSVSLDISYRSTQEVLDIVYKVFSDLSLESPELFNSSDLVKLKCAREANYGSVQLWDIETTKTKSQNAKEVFWPIAFTDKSNEISSDSSCLLAKKIAHYINLQISSQRILSSTKQPIQYSDFLILVRRRNKFVKQLVVELRKLNLKVSGIDRVSLKDHLSIIDLVALAKFVITPSDDLNLACLLKSSFIGCSEEDIYFLCKNKELKDSIWQFLAVVQKDNLYYQNIVNKLLKFIELYCTTTPDYFFHLVIEVLNYRQVLINANIEDGNDIIDEFLKTVEYFFASFSPSLREFIIWFESHDFEIKRDVDTQDCINIMTIHAAKGLQAPIVILPDTTTLPISPSGILWDNNGNMLWPTQSQYYNDYFKKQIEILKSADYQEYLRLLYVAMTRAEDELIICGYSITATLSQGCWYNIIQKSISKIFGISRRECNLGFTYINKVVYNRAEISSELAVNLEQEGSHFKYGNSLKEKSYIKIGQGKNDCSTLLNLIFDFKFELNRVLELKFLNVNLISLSKFSPLDGEYGINYGVICHKILEEVVKNRTAKFLVNNHYFKLLTIKQKNKVEKTLNALFASQEFNYLLNSYELKSEVNLGLIQLSNNSSIENNHDMFHIDNAKVFVFKRIDLLVIKNNHVIIIDYKTDFSVPKTQFKVQASYLKQLRSYYDIVKLIYPAHKVSAKILWLENIYFMNINL
ncbi:uvrD/REP helicase N-terminal domain protein [Orientia chuto str. Dubai]|uniref:DNA 3'-5' helicase n=1 Tax=Orientia chuto str. Dubai TaxID=1359168 RepID=A0A0F3MM69_9RICK|nr:UvrD-helicase domain-containing protein [Candidatus Orientia mediorientalis]KJV56756.1 uvrD/REP helicase N-terminal domain protein [Orientia chuto str. Dubai]